MKKALLFSAALLAAAGVINAQETTDNGYTAIPAPADNSAIMFTISPNGRYVGGYTYVDNKFYVYDAQSKTAKAFGEEGEDNITTMKAISNDGKAVGTLGDGTNTYGFICNFADGTSETVEAGMTKAITPDGSFMTGATMSEDEINWNAVYFDGKNTVALPEPSSKWAGWVSSDPDDPEVILGSSADFVSSDKSVIAGYVIDPLSTYPAIVWRLNRDGKTYSADLISRNYFCCNPDNVGTDRNNYALFLPTAMSENGKWLALTVAKYAPDGWSSTYGFGRYNLDTDELEEYFYDDGTVSECYSAGIANDGTMTGWIGGYNEEQGTIWKTGVEAPQLLSEVYTGVPEFAEFDTNLGHKPCAISADGRYIAGYGFYTRTDATSGEEITGYESYIFDTTAKGATTAVKTVPVVNNTVNKTATAARYDLSGRQVDKDFMGISILRTRAGRVLKTLNK